MQVMPLGTVQDASALKTGDRLEYDDGSTEMGTHTNGTPSTVAITGIIWNAKASSVQAACIVYNLSISDTHTYFVGNVQGGIWVHNDGLTSVIGRGMARVRQYASNKGFDYYKPLSNFEGDTEGALENNQNWINRLMDNGVRIEDTGYNKIDSLSDFFQMEQESTVDYENVTSQVFEYVLDD